MSFFEELKRRNVIRVGIAYVIVAWLILQFADVVLNNIEAPGWVFQAIMLVLVIGLPLALFFAWAFELTPEGLKKEKDVDRSQSITPQTGQKLNRAIIAVLVLALGYFVVDKFYLSAPATGGVENAATKDTGTQEEAGNTPQTIAVLPFVDMSAGGDNEYFSDGLTEELLNILAKIRELRVAGRTSSFAFKGKDEDLRSIGEKLNVATILEGSVRKDTQRNRVRITAQLINVEDGYHLWSETYDRDLEDIFAIQEEIARKVAAALRITLLGEDEARITQQPVTDLNAYDLYLKGLNSFNQYSFASLKRALDEFDQAIAKDPAYVPAQLKRAQTWLGLSQTGVVPRAEAISNAKPVLLKILQEDGGNSEAHALLARTYRFERQYDNAEREFRLALDTNPRNVYALSEFGRLLTDFGQVSRGMEYLFEAGRVDPYSVQVLWNLHMAHAFMVEREKAAQYTNRIAEIQPGNPMRYYGPAMAFRFEGNLAQALLEDQKAIELDPNDYELPADMAITWTMLGDLEQAEFWARKADETGADQPVPIMARVLLYQYREQYGLAADLARRAIDRGVDNRQASNNVLRNAWVSNLLRTGKIDEALAYYNENLPEAFQSPPVIETKSPRNTSQLLEIATLLQMQNPGSAQALALINTVEQKTRAVEESWIPWATAIRRAAIATARGDKTTAINILHDVPNNKFGGRWRELLVDWFVLEPLHQEPGYKRLITLLEKDMEQQRTEAYRLLGVAR